MNSASGSFFGYPRGLLGGVVHVNPAPLAKAAAYVLVGMAAVYVLVGMAAAYFIYLFLGARLEAVERQRVVVLLLISRPVTRLMGGVK